MQLKSAQELAHKQTSLTKLEVLLLNICELVVDQNEHFKKEIQSLKNVINQLKGEQGTPRIRKQTKGKSNDHSSENNRKNKNRKKPRHKTGSKKGKVKPHQTVTLTINPSDLPLDSVCNGVKKTLIQDINVRANNTLFARQQYYSKLENKYYLAPLPSGYEGEYGPNIKSWSNVLYSPSEMTLENITGLFNTAGVRVSKSTVHGFVITAGTDMADEKIAIAKAGFKSTPYQHLDDTGGREKGKNCYVNVVGNELFSAYFTLHHKDRLSIIKMLSLDDVKCALNPLAFELMKTMRISEDVMMSLQAHISPNHYSQLEIEKILETVFGGQKQTQQRKLILEAAAISAYRESPYAISQLIVDDAPQFKLITEALGLCWIHEGRHYKKLNPIFKNHKVMTEDFIDQFWGYYETLLDYKEKPTEESARKLNAEFKRLFSTKTGYENLDKQISATLNKITPLLLVLKYPNIPIHNNLAELMARRQARARDIHLHTMSEEGTQAKDTLATITGTAKKLSVNTFQYFYDRITRKFEMTSLAELIARRSINFNSE